VRLTTSLVVGAKYFGCVVCMFHVAAGAELRQIGSINKLSRASPSQLASTFGSAFFLLLVRLNLGFILRETCRCAHHTFLLGFPTRWLSTANHTTAKPCHVVACSSEQHHRLLALAAVPLAPPFHLSSRSMAAKASASGEPRPLVRPGMEHARWRLRGWRQRRWVRGRPRESGDVVAVHGIRRDSGGAEKIW
jgi:hypothetical protein